MSGLVVTDFVQGRDYTLMLLAINEPVAKSSSR